MTTNGRRDLGPVTDGHVALSVSAARAAPVTWDGQELVRAVGYQVRDAGWGTFRGHLVEHDVEESADRLVVDQTVRYGDPTFLHVRLRLTADRDGLAVTATATAERAFDTARMGWVVLLPPRWAGADVCSGGAGAHWAGALSEDVHPQWEVGGAYQPMFPGFTELRLRQDDGTELHARFEGEVFEMEDQRNWTDASYKVYGTPLSRPYPVRVNAGESRRQTVTIRGRAHRSAGAASSPDEVDLRSLVAAGEVRNWSVPRLGALAGPSPRGLAHVRVEARGGSATLVEDVTAGLRNARDHDVPVELAVFARAEQLAEDVDRVRAALAAGPEVRVAHVLALADGDDLAGPAAVEACRALVEDTVPVGGGTDGYFAAVNRRPPTGADWDLLAFALCPQVHDVDDLSVMQTLPVQETVLAAARRMLPDAGLAVGPVTLRPRRRRDGPDHADPRLVGPFGVAWTVGSVAAATRAGAVSVTYAVDGPIAAVLAGLGELRNVGRTALDEAHAVLAGRTGDTYTAWVAALTRPRDVLVPAHADVRTVAGAVQRRSAGHWRLVPPAVVRVAYDLEH